MNHTQTDKGGYTFGKEDRLCSKLAIDALFRSGRSFKEYPIRVMYLPLKESATPAKLLITVPKKRFKKAVDRNRVKRLIRETYRLNRSEMMEHWRTDGKYFALGFVYIGNDIPLYGELNTAMEHILEKLKTVTS